MYEIFEQLLLKFGVTAYQVAKATGISTATLTNWKKGRYTPKQDKLQKIADYFGVPVSELTEETKKAPTPEGEREITMDDFTYAFYKESKDLPDEKKKMLLDMARFMKSDIEKGKG